MLIIEIFEDFCEPSSKLVSFTDLQNLEEYLDQLFSRVNIDVVLTGRHFIERVNDQRNGKQITICELQSIFKEFFKEYSLKISKQKDGFEAVLADLNSHINLPFLIKYDRRNKELDLIAKTIMRKKNFKTSEPKLIVDTGL